MTARCRAAGLLSLLLAAAAAAPSDQQPSSAAEQQPSSAAEQLAALLGPVVEEAVSRALDDRERAEVAADRQALGRLERRLEATLQDVAALQTAMATLQQAAANRSGELEPACQRSPSPLPVVAAPHRQPAARACARSCLQLRDQGGSPQDGVYWFTEMPVPVLCDFSHDGGGWTLLLTAISRPGWDLYSVLQRNERSPSLTDNYSILRHGDTIRDLGSGGRFAYRIEAQAQTGRRRWGGLWFAPRHYSFVDETGDQTQIRLVRKFDNWAYKDTGIEKRMPWLRAVDDFTVLTTTGTATSNRYGTLVLNKVQGSYWQHSPWIDDGAEHTGTLLYWMREEEL